MSSTSSARTATLALATVRANDERWHGVPFHLLSGSKLHHKHTYVRVQFRKLPILGGALGGMAPDDRAEAAQVIFHIDGGIPERSPAVYVVPKPALNLDLCKASVVWSPTLCF